MGRDRDCVTACTSGAAPVRAGVRVGRLVSCALALGLGLAAATAWADTAEVLPEGVSSTSIAGNFYRPIDERYGAGGHVEDAAVDFNADLNSSVFPDLALVEAGFGMPAGSATLGSSVVHFKYDFQIMELTFLHGVTPRLSLGFKIPYWWVRNGVGARLDASAATVGKVPFSPFLAPVAAGATPLTTDDVQDLIGPGLDTTGDGAVDIPGFGFDRVQTWSDSGLSDIEVGGRYQYHSGDAFRLAFTGGVRLPTGRVDDPDKLMDYAFGSGAYALLFHFNNDYTALKDWLFDLSLLYEWYLPDRQVLRVPDDVNQPLTSNRENVHRNIVDVYGTEVTVQRTIAGAVSASGTYKYRAAMKDSVNGRKGFDYHSLEQETDWMEQVATLGLTYSTLERFAKTRSGVPMEVTLSYRNRFDGKNNVLKSQYVGLEASLYF
jgi:hypothetical protein